MFRVFCATLLAVVLAAAKPADEQTIAVNVDLVNVYLTVCNQKGRLIANLGRDSFTVFEDGQLQTITNFSRETDAPLAIVMVVDTSGSVWDKLAFEKDAAAEFLYSTVRPGRDKVALLTFDSFVDVQQDYTDDPAVVAKAVKQVRSGGGTRLYDALDFVLKQKLAGSEERKVIILITDGNDNASRRSLEEVLDLAQRSNVSIYAISVNGIGYRRTGSDEGDGVLEMLASETGGRPFFPAKPSQLASHFKNIADELRSQYTIAYRSTNLNRDGAFRKIRIEVKKNRHSVRTRSGYFAPVSVTAGGTR